MRATFRQHGALRYSRGRRFDLGVEVLAPEFVPHAPAPVGATDVRMVQQDFRALYVSVAFGL